MNEAEKSLFEASATGDILAVELALKTGVEINTKEKNGDTALNIACKNGHIEIVKLLLSKGADVQNPGAADMLPLMNASVEGNWDIVQFLVESGVSISDELLSIINMKVNILKENVESGMVVEEALEAWKRFQAYLRKMRLKQDLPEIFKALSSQDEELRNRALESLEPAANFGFDLAPVIGELKQFLTSENQDTGATAAVTLAAYFIHTGNWAEISALCKDIRNSILLGVMSALVSFSKAGFDLTPLLQEILMFLQNNSEDLRHDAAIVTGYLATHGFETGAAVSPLALILKESEPSMRKIASWAFYRMAKYGKVDLSSVLNRLKELQADENEEVSTMATEVITVIENQEQDFEY